VTQHIQPEQIAASIARLREEGVLSLANTQPTTPSTTPAYPPYLGQAQVHNLGIIPEHLAEGIAGLDAGRDEGLDSGSNPCTPIPTPLSPSPAQHSSVLAEQLAAGIHKLKVEVGMSSGGSTGMPTTPAPTPFSHGPGGVRPEDLAAGISRLSVIQEAADTGPSPSAVAINVLEATDTSISNNTSSNLSNYFGSPQSSGESIFDQLTTTGNVKVRSRSNSSSGGPGFQDVTINTPAKRVHLQNSVPTTPYSGSSLSGTPQATGSGPTSSTPNLLSAEVGVAGSSSRVTTDSPIPSIEPITRNAGVPRGLVPQQLDINALALSQQYATPQGISSDQPPSRGATSNTPSVDILSPASSSMSAYATPSAVTPIVESRPTGFSLQSVGETSTTATPIKAITPVNVGGSNNLHMAPARPESPATAGKVANSLFAEAWIPKPACKEVLDNMAHTPGTFFPSRDQLTCPGVAPGSEQGDPIRDLVAKYQGEGEASKRHTLAADGVTADTRGLQQLIAVGNYRAAVNLTAQLLEMYGQGRGKAGQLSKHSQSSLQIWFTRLALLVKLRLFTVAEAEADHFGDLDRPDVFFQYYPEMYGSDRRGSLAPWSMRLLLAQLPGLSGKHVLTTNKLFALLFAVRKLIANLTAGLAADGGVWLDATDDERRAASECWRERERRVVYSLINNAISCADFESAIKCLDMLVPIEKDERKAALHAAYGRLYLQLGNLRLADNSFVKASKLRDFIKPEDQLEGLLDSAFLAIGQGQFGSALERFQSALPLSSGKMNKVIRNNIAVCLLYLGKLKEGLQLIENSITSDTSNIQGNPILNLCTLYELESSYALQKKIGMLGLVSIHCSDSYPTSSLKL